MRAERFERSEAPGSPILVALANPENDPGARQHNLKNIDVEIPRNNPTVLAGTGKVSLQTHLAHRLQNFHFKGVAPPGAKLDQCALWSKSSPR